MVNSANILSLMMQAQLMCDSNNAKYTDFRILKKSLTLQSMALAQINFVAMASKSTMRTLHRILEITKWPKSTVPPRNMKL